MKRWPIWKRIRLLWILIAVAGCFAALASLTWPLAMVHAHTRTNLRLMEIQQMPPNAQVPVKAYREACEDADNMVETGTDGMMQVMIPCGVIVLLASWGSRLNKRIRQLEDEAQSARRD